jgi:hypothetical protein
MPVGEGHRQTGLAREASRGVVAVVESMTNFPWSICLAREDAGSLATLRLTSGIEVGDHGATVWLRGQRGDEKLEAKLSALPARARYEWLSSNQLRRIDQRIPTDSFPVVPWQSLNTWLQVEMPSAAIPAEPPLSVPLRLVRSNVEQEPELLLTRLDDLIRFASMAAQVRLERLQFAANGTAEVLVRGRPLPPVPGRRFVLHGSVAVPAGFSWEPKVSADVLIRRFAVSSDALVVWNEDHTITRLHSEQFVPLSRSALRATQQETEAS